nr:signal peptidase II [Lysinibacter cavernae]
MFVLLALAAVIYLIDQLTKNWVVANLPYGISQPVLGEFLQFHFVRNPGAAFSLASGSTWIFAILASCVVLFIIWYSARIRSVGWAVFLGLLLGGTVGNLSDRFFREPGFPQGHVVDFISTPWMIPAIYNMADIFIVSSMAIFVMLTFRGIRIDGTREPSKKERAAAEAAETAEEPGRGE